MPRSADYVMYWWHRAAQRVSAGRTRRFGLITTNSLRQAFNRRVVRGHPMGISWVCYPAVSMWLGRERPAALWKIASDTTSCAASTRFRFPIAERIVTAITAIAEELDALRKERLRLQPDSR